jgi:hypothetical protein
LVPETFQYVSQKAPLLGRERDMTKAALTCEPLNNDIADKIEKIPISQKLPIGTVFTLDVENKYQDGVFKFLWSG